MTVTTLSTHKRGYYQDQAIIGLLEECGILNTNQLHYLVAPEVSYKFFCRKLNHLANDKRIKRDRYSMAEPYFYWVGKRPNPSRVEHLLGVRWAYTFLRLEQELSNLKINSFQFEPKEYEPIVEPDGFTPIEYTLKSDNYFIEFERAESGNEFDKFPKYDALFKKLFYDRKEGKKSYWWINLDRDQSFRVLIITTGNKERLIKRMKNEKAYGYRVEILTLDEIREKCAYNAQLLKSRILAERSV